MASGLTTRRPQLTPALLLLCAAGFLALHAACIAFFPAPSAPVSSVFFTVLPILAALVCFVHARECGPSVRRLWSLFGTALALWAIASVLLASELNLLHQQDNAGSLSQIVYFLYGVPLVLAIASPTEGSWNATAIWLDGIQIFLVGFLAYITTFNAVPFSHQTLIPVAATKVALIFNIENIVLACAATFRLLATSPRTGQRRFHSALTIFLWVYAISVTFYNHIDLVRPNPGYYDLLADISFLALILLVLMPRRDTAPDTAFRFGESLALFIDTASPILFPAAILAFGIDIAHHHFTVGITAIVLSMSVYGLRSTLLQLDYHRAQIAAKNARDSMEVISLTDPLTGIANRRHFDRLIHSTWDQLSLQHGSLSLLLIDIDYFKHLNDAFGHAEGDISLRQVANGLNATLQREYDMLARYGGEEFAAILPGADKAGAEAVALRMRNTLAGLCLRNCCPLGDTVTVSIGVSTCDLPCEASMEELFEAADRALYRAKQNGRDRVEFEPLHLTSPEIMPLSTLHPSPT